MMKWLSGSMLRSFEGLPSKPTADQRHRMRKPSNSCIDMALARSSWHLAIVVMRTRGQSHQCHLLYFLKRCADDNDVLQGSWLGHQRVMLLA
mmetsp:Transcript_116472/g.218036  ORF Transcript_116472/g.218036 Transcript_116472/m.218036 type:complete len:92 (-) Transcript_116472:116-391(-)